LSCDFIQDTKGRKLPELFASERKNSRSRKSCGEREVMTRNQGEDSKISNA
jgi:hypothetical protein